MYIWLGSSCVSTWLDALNQSPYLFLTENNYWTNSGSSDRWADKGMWCIPNRSESEHKPAIIVGPSIRDQIGLPIWSLQNRMGTANTDQLHTGKSIRLDNPTAFLDSVRENWWPFTLLFCLVVGLLSKNYSSSFSNVNIGAHTRLGWCGWLNLTSSEVMLAAAFLSLLLKSG